MDHFHGVVERVERAQEIKSGPWSSWWHRRTVLPFTGEGELIARVLIDFSLKERLMILFGHRRIEMEIRSQQEPDLTNSDTHRLIDTLSCEAHTRPAVWYY